jgi:pimeloyl-ACP methyl ester carboxylesterase
MSTPPFLDLPSGVRATRVPTARGPLAALHGVPDTRSPEPVLLVPGYTGSKEDFIAVLEPIVAAGHEVLAIDQRGQFESPGDDDPSSYDVKILAEDVLAVLDEVSGGRPVHLVGHSFGGLVARAVAVADPGALASLTLMSSGPAAVPPPANANVGLMAQALPVMDLESIWVAKRQLEADAELERPAPHIEDWLHRRFVANHPVALLRMAEQLLTEADRTDELAATGVATMVLFGDRDDVWPPDLQAATAERLGASTAALRGVGHSPAAEAAEATAASLLSFWAGAR